MSQYVKVLVFVGFYSLFSDNRKIKFLKSTYFPLHFTKDENTNLRTKNQIYFANNE